MPSGDLPLEKSSVVVVVTPRKADVAEHRGEMMAGGSVALCTDFWGRERVGRLDSPKEDLGVM